MEKALKKTKALWREKIDPTAPNDPRWAQGFLSCIAFFSVALLLSAYQSFPTLASFGHDEVHYYHDFHFKLIEDGRWLNYLLHDFLRSIPTHTWAALLLIASWMLFFRLAKALELEVRQAIIFASTVLTVLPFAEQSLWPATTIPAVAVLLLSSLLIKRKVPYQVTYIFCGLLIFGTLQSFYFLLPLFFLSSFSNTALTQTKRWHLFLSHMIWWMAGAVAGVLLMSFALWLLTGSFGVKPAEWRRIQPIQDMDGLIRNTLYTSREFVNYFIQLAKSSGIYTAWFAIIITAISVIRIRSWKSSPQKTSLIIAVGMAFFAFSTPLAPAIQTRSLIAFSAAFITAIALLPGRTSVGKIAASTMLLLIGYTQSINTDSYLSKHHKTSQFFQQKIQEILPSPIESYKAIALFGTMEEKSIETRTFNSPPLMHGILHSMGINDYWDCRQGLDHRCEGIKNSEIVSTKHFLHGKLQLSLSEENIAAIKFTPNPPDTHQD